MVEVPALQTARDELSALATLIERPPLDDVRLEQSVAMRTAAAIRIVLATPDPVEAQALPGREVIAAALFEHEQSDVKWADWVKHVRGRTLLEREVEKYRSLADAVLALAQPGSSDEVERLRRGLMNAMLCLSGFAGQGITVEGFDDPADVYGASADLIGMPDADDDDLRTALSTPSHANGGEGA